MDEQRLRTRRELIQRAKQKNNIRNKNQSSGNQFFLFRISVTIMLVGVAVMLSFSNTDTANTITESLKEAIAYEMPVATIQQWKQKAVSVFQNTKQDITKPQQTNTTNETSQINQTNETNETNETDISSTTNTSKEQKANRFQPDLNENSGKIP